MPKPLCSQVTRRTTYCSIGYHRNSQWKAEKDQWRVPLSVEFAIFRCALGTRCCDQEFGWGLLLTQLRPQVLGENTFQEDLFIAKFRRQRSRPMWHGHPADYRRKAQDRPPQKVLLRWVRAGIIQKNHMAQIKSGLKCSLLS